MSGNGEVLAALTSNVKDKLIGTLFGSLATALALWWAHINLDGHRPMQIQVTGAVEQLDEIKELVNGLRRDMTQMMVDVAALTKAQAEER